jgi:hypothetical protein
MLMNSLRQIATQSGHFGISIRHVHLCERSLITVKIKEDGMQDSLALTVAAGIAIFILSQFFMEFILDPSVALKEVLGELSHFFLFNQSKITNA